MCSQKCTDMHEFKRGCPDFVIDCIAFVAILTPASTDEKSASSSVSLSASAQIGDETFDKKKLNLNLAPIWTISDIEIFMEENQFFWLRLRNLFLKSFNSYQSMLSMLWINKKYILFSEITQRLKTIFYVCQNWVIKINFEYTNMHQSLSKLRQNEKHRCKGSKL